MTNERFLIQSGLASEFGHDLAAAHGNLYRVNDWDRMSVWDGYRDSALAAGISMPVAGGWPTNPLSVQIATGSKLYCDLGTHLVRYRYMNSKTGWVSDPRSALTINAKEGSFGNPLSVSTEGTGSRYRLSGLKGSSDPKVDRIVVEMTTANGGVFYVATAIANKAGGSSSVTLGVRDANLLGSPTFWDEFGHTTPPFFSIVEPFRGRLWGIGHNIYETGLARLKSGTTRVSGSGTAWTSAAKDRFFIFSGSPRRYVKSVVGATHIILDSGLGGSVSMRTYSIVSETTNVLRFSKPLFLESWPVEHSIKTLNAKPEKARALKGYRQDLLIFGERSMERLVFSEDPFLDGALEPVQGERGAASRHCVQDIGGYIFSLDYHGIHRYAGGTPEHVSTPLDPLFDPGDTAHGYVDFQYRTTFHSVHYPARQQILWFVVINGEPDDGTAYTQPQHAIAMDYGSGLFTVYKFDVPIVASTSAPGSDGTVQTLLADANGRLWTFGIGATDGVNATGATSFTVKSGTTASNVLASSSVLYASNGRMDGAFAHWVEGDQTKRIQSNSAAALVLANPFSSAPAKGDTITLGRIPSKWKSKAFVCQSPSFRWMDGRYLHLYYEPSSSGTIRVRFYIDRGSTAYSSYAVALSNDGVTLDPTTDYYVVDVSTSTGYARIPLPGTGHHTVEIEIEVVDSATSFEMTGFDLDGYAVERDLGA